jgi:hypothetical protein
MLTLWAASLFGAREKKGRVDLSEVDEQGKVVWQRQVSIDEARNFAMHILEAAEAAETDEILWYWLQDEVKAGSEQNLAKMLLAFRAIRDSRRTARQQ